MDKNISFVVQGPVGPHTPACLASIRSFFPQAELILSTWAGSNVEGLTFDKVIFNGDPDAHQKVGNIRRFIKSSVSGIISASNHIICKLRSDLVFLNNNILKEWDKDYPTKSLAIAKKRFLIPGVQTCHPDRCYCLHPSDWAICGYKEDLLNYFSLPMPDPDQPICDHWGGLLAPQYMWCYFVNKLLGVSPMNGAYDRSPETIELTKQTFAANLVVLDTMEQFGVICQKYPYWIEGVQVFNMSHLEYLEILRNAR